jgi:hypothetical protein
METHDEGRMRTEDLASGGGGGAATTEPQQPTAPPPETGEPHQPGGPGGGETAAPQQAPADAGGADATATQEPTAGAGGTGTAGAHDASAGAGGATAERNDESTPLLPDPEASDFEGRWHEVQIGFVDEPQRCVKEADGLVAEVMQRLADGFAHERGELEAQWASGGEVSTEDLRVALQRYRSFFNRLLRTG